jgi:hypothetical protein
VDQGRQIKMLFMQAGVAIGYLAIAGFCFVVGYLALPVFNNVQAPPAQIIAAPGQSANPPSAVTPPTVTIVPPLPLTPGTGIFRADIYSSSTQGQ